MRKPDAITHLVIHCADTPDGDSRYSIADIDSWHGERGFQRNRELVDGSTGWRHVGYHGVIHVDGSMRQGRLLEEVGSHCRGLNQVSVGYCLIGRQRFTKEQWDTLRSEVIFCTKVLAQPLKIIGHREVNDGKECPGFNVRSWLLGGMSPHADHLFQE